MEKLSDDKNEKRLSKLSSKMFEIYARLAHFLKPIFHSVNALDCSDDEELTLTMSLSVIDFGSQLAI